MPDKVVAIPGVGNIAFPDTMSEADIAAASAKIFKEKQGAFDIQARPSSALERGAEQFYEKSPLAPAVALVKGTANVVAHPLDTYFGLAPVADTVKDLAKAQWDEAVKAAQKAKEATSGGGMLSASEAFGHGLAAILPVLGPAAANVGEHFAAEDIAGGVGGTLGLLFPFAAKYGLDVKRVANPARAAKLTREASAQVAERVLAPGNPRYKGTAAKIAPEVLKRGLKGDRLDLQQIAEEGMADANARIDAAVQIDPKQPIPLQPVLDALDREIADHQLNGQTVKGYEARVAALKAQRDFIQQQGTTLPFDEVRKLRKLLDDQAAEAKVYERAGNQDISELGRASAEAAGALRQSLVGTRPELQVPNADYAFFKRLADVLDPTKGRPKQTNYVPSGITGGMTTAGAIIGKSFEKVPIVGPFASLAGSQILPKIKAMVASPSWELASATKKMQLAEALRRGDRGRIESLIFDITRAGPRGLSRPALHPQAVTAQQTDQR